MVSSDALFEGAPAAVSHPDVNRDAAAHALGNRAEILELGQHAVEMFDLVACAAEGKGNVDRRHP